MIKKLFLAVLLVAGTGAAGLYAQTVPPATPVQKSLIIAPKKDTGVDLIQQKPIMQNQQGLLSQQAQQTDNTPAAVKQSFAAAMPNATNVTWNAHDNHYEVEFTSNGIDKIRVYDSRGDLHEIGLKQDVKAIPAGIKAYVKKNYTGETIVSAYKVFMIENASASTQPMPDKTMDNTSMMPDKTPDNSMAAVDNQQPVADKSMSKSDNTKSRDLSCYRVTTTSHLLYFDSDGKFNHEGYSVLTSGL